MKPYDEDQVLTDYIWHNYQHLMEGAEKLAFKVVLGEQKAASSSSTAMKEAIRQHGGSSEPEVFSLLSAGPDEFRRGVRNRLLRDYPNEIRSIGAQSANISRELQKLGNVLGVSTRGGSFIA